MKKIVSIIGGGPAALSLASFLDQELFDVTIYERNKSLGRKFLVAGKGGFNLTHSENIDEMIQRYSPVDFLKKALQEFGNNDLRAWLKELGIETYVGSSKRVYPEVGIKPVEVLNVIVESLKSNGVDVKYEHEWTGWNRRNEIVFNKSTPVKADYVVFALGGGSWKVTGSDGGWLDLFSAAKIATLPFQASNCGFKVEWAQAFASRFAGDPLKNVTVSCGDQTSRGEMIVTSTGLEGGAIYALSPQIRDLLNQSGKCIISIDLKPTLSVEDIVRKLSESTMKNTTDSLKQDLKLSPAQLGMVKQYVTKEDFVDPAKLAVQLKNLQLNLLGAASIEESISTVGGIDLKSVDGDFRLTELKDTYCIGEMLDWDAPTGGYLLQACFSMGAKLAKKLNSTSSKP